MFYLKKNSILSFNKNKKRTTNYLPHILSDSQQHLNIPKLSPLIR
ncbi:hypothetical protein MARI151_10556 [Maribacter litoralis]|uniref:Uncharacterized protein n=1 Tax=Maribacter litoralis TaxID=2059726 RepID=A0A653N3W6_9FLAO|nr:hypothetical protein MARI151_10556 [Maribacter litoralis]